MGAYINLPIEPQHPVVRNINPHSLCLEIHAGCQKIACHRRDSPGSGEAVNWA